MTNEIKPESRKAARAGRQPLDCGGLTPLFLRMVERALRRAFPVRPPHHGPCVDKPKRLQAAAVQSLAALTRRSERNIRGIAGRTFNHTREGVTHDAR